MASCRALGPPPGREKPSLPTLESPTANAMTQVASYPSRTAVADAEPWLRTRAWDRIFMTGGALLVAVPIVLYYLFTGLGASIATAEDLVTLVVMVLVGGPHVFATYTRTFLQPGFKAREPLMFLSGLLVIAVVVTAAASSAFFQTTIGGYPPIQYVLTFFFFWAGIHIVHQAAYCATCYGIRAGDGRDRRRKWLDRVDYVVMLGCLYPMAFFRMSMIGDATAGAPANPDALATQIVTDMTGSTAFANEYVFRIGRVAPILPEFVRANFFWIAVTIAFFAAVAVFAWKSWKQHQEGTLNRPRFLLVASTAIVGFVVPWFPNLDTSFQGFNAWHSFQYLGIVWLWNRQAYDRGEARGTLAQTISAPGRAKTFYMVALAGTIGLLLLILVTGWLIEFSTAGQFRMFGHDQVPIDATTGQPEYRPGAVLLAYYMVAFAFLLVHYLHDGIFFLRHKDLVPEAAQRG